MGTVNSLGLNQHQYTSTECTNWTRSIYCSPLSKTLSVAPSFVFRGHPSSILNKLKEAYEAGTGKKYEEEDNGYDEFGWKLLSCGRYNNIFFLKKFQMLIP
ncbi:hypothetical protein EDC94DRAFT_610005 [Helicostylum pulchrum]|nr:hypothetical protein EDC94DRAFT_610005 [Helicostylum pulchrum]